MEEANATCFFYHPEPANSPFIHSSISSYYFLRYNKFLSRIKKKKKKTTIVITSRRKKKQKKISMEWWMVDKPRLGSLDHLLPCHTPYCKASTLNFPKQALCFSNKRRGRGFLLNKSKRWCHEAVEGPLPSPYVPDYLPNYPSPFHFIDG